jgi:hypothetical protein
VPQVGKGVRLAAPVTEVAVDAERLFQIPGRTRIVRIRLPRAP